MRNRFQDLDRRLKQVERSDNPLLKHIKRNTAHLVPPPGIPAEYDQALRSARQYTQSIKRLHECYGAGPVPLPIPRQFQEVPRSACRSEPLFPRPPIRQEDISQVIESTLVDDEPRTNRHEAATNLEISPIPVPSTDDQARSRRSFLGWVVAGGLMIGAGSWLTSQMVPLVSPTIPTSTEHHQVTLIRQTDRQQYTSDQEWQTWRDSTCSSTALAMIANAYGHSYRVTDILAIQIQLGEITVREGLLHGHQSIQTIVKYLGFQAKALESLEEAVQAANSGTPVMIGVIGSQWPSGHFVVLVSGNGTTVQVCDPWPSNLTTVDLSMFKQWWSGFASLVTPNPASIIGSPSITADFINQVLITYSSPAQGKGQTLYDLGVEYGLDPVFALAFFMHESSFGKAGMATKTLSLGNLRCIPDQRCEENFAWFKSWEEGFHAWFVLISDLYIRDWGRTTVAEIIPKYAPAADNNNEQQYIDSVLHAVEVWRTGKVVVG